MKRTHNCGELRKEDIGKTVSLAGWVDRRRDLGGVIFVDLRDKFGKTQVVFNPERNAEVHKIADKIRNEYVIYITGEVQARPEGMENDKLATGAVDVKVDKLEILNEAQTSPIEINNAKEESKENDDFRLQYRYLDLRRPWIQKNLLLKSRFLKAVYDFFYANGFENIETPVLCKSTPEGARDYLVPSRVNPGKFYALPQSPQQYKQLLMIAGFDRYFQIAKCFRDEDLRADRQPEFTQIDVEMSFVNQDEVMDMFDQFVTDVLGKVWNFEPPRHIRRMKWHEAMLKYGSDKPDLRFDLEIHDVSEIAIQSNFGVFKNAVAAGGKVRGLAAKGCVDFTRKQIDDLTAYVAKYGAKGLVWMRVKENDTVETQVGKFFTTEQLNALRDAIEAKEGDMMFFIAGPEKVAATAMGQLRLEVARIKGLRDPKKREFVWITEFPMFEYSETEGRYMAMHHPFTNPLPEHLQMMLDGNLKDCNAEAYDLVLNGVEIGGGSIRIHDPKVQEKVFRLLGLSEEQVRDKFGFFVDAFKFGAPPHGGLAFGLDRVVATMEGQESIRDFIAFPKNTSASSPMDQCPSEVDVAQLNDLHVSINMLDNQKKA
ncbi:MULTISPECIES: aspartate--tRNA ligase [Fibrobacter]|uniref:Aspartate--tRNA(Asp/Asn) ligase n=3 Tax=Fibrobacter TaxID=832 RepID=A0A1M6UIF9_9BACT|nr:MULTISPECIES: aspartate--tRNA ligase [Fibrobacter]MDD7298267.1 aspartate--tRNA ligase [Fibrobacter intestinalis]PBC67210.1 aspartyl-tRNA synthetase [Fibrobacter sp. UWS1]PBC73278.1 aspartyl-tRNA synthetase [Fibrobacter sp. NR9]SHK68969.1 aspartyl-tRNA synthetase [Fibrobacter intestinalis]SJZ82797.1 aspartyl-tRNA synthetase [Fibrobacter intestinalis]